MNNAIQVGVSKDAVREARAVIMQILEASCEERTKRVALSALCHVCDVTNTTIQNCHFAMGEDQ